MSNAIAGSKAVSKPRIAVDTNYIIAWSDYRDGTNPTERSDDNQKAHDGLEKLLSLAKNGVIVLGVSRRFLADKIQDRQPIRKQRHMEGFDLLTRRGVHRIQSTCSFDLGWGRFAAEDDRVLRERLMKVLHPGGINPDGDKRWHNKLVDIDHLRDAIAAGFTLFVTNDTKILRKNSQLSECGIEVMTMEEAVEHGF